MIGIETSLVAPGRPYDRRGVTFSRDDRGLLLFLFARVAREKVVRSPRGLEKQPFSRARHDRDDEVRQGSRERANHVRLNHGRTKAFLTVVQTSRINNMHALAHTTAVLFRNQMRYTLPRVPVHVQMFTFLRVYVSPRP